MRDKPTPWKLDRPYDPDERAATLRKRFSRYRARNGIVAPSRAAARFWPVWLLVAAGIVALFAFAT
jgi:hypothetical protein